MTMNQKDRDALNQNWDQARSQIQSQFPDLTDDDLNSGQQNPDQLVDRVAQNTGQERTAVEQQFKAIADQYSS